MTSKLSTLDQALAKAEQLAASLTRPGAAPTDQLRMLETTEGLLQEVETHTAFETALATQDAPLAKAAHNALDRVARIRATTCPALMALSKRPNFSSDPALVPFEKWRDRVARQTPKLLDGQASRHVVALQSIEQGLKTARTQCLGLGANGETAPALKAHLTSPDAEVRSDAYQKLVVLLKERRDLHATLFDSFLTCRIAQAQALGFDKPEERRHAQNNANSASLEALSSALASSQSQVTPRFYKDKATWMGQDQLDYWDRAAPLSSNTQNHIPFENARNLILDAFDDVDPDYRDIAGQFFSKGWIDAFSRAGKTEGGFCLPGSPDTSPRIVLNYRGSVRCVLELAHELGHAIHYWYARGRGPLRAPTPFPIAETAAIFAEQIAFNALLDAEPNEKAKTRLQRRRRQDFINTCYRQNALYQFERAAYAQKALGSLSADWLEGAFATHEGALIGPDLLPQRDFGGLYFLVPHFFEYPFYMYAYPFGELTACLLADVQKADPGRFYQQFREMMALGGDCHLSDMEALFGFDLTREATWQQALKASPDAAQQECKPV
ncbi:MAG: M3 family metallopeptidase [Pseudomonadota bacterium]